MSRIVFRLATVRGPTAFIVDAYVQGFGTFVQQFIPMSTFQADTEWLSY